MGFLSFNDGDGSQYVINMAEVAFYKREPKYMELVVTFTLRNGKELRFALSGETYKAFMLAEPTLLGFFGLNNDKQNPQNPPQSKAA